MDELGMWEADLEHRISQLVLAAWNVGGAYALNKTEAEIQPLREALFAARDSLRNLPKYIYHSSTPSCTTSEVPQKPETWERQE